MTKGVEKIVTNLRIFCNLNYININNQTVGLKNITILIFSSLRLSNFIQLFLFKKNPVYIIYIHEMILLSALKSQSTGGLE